MGNRFFGPGGAAFSAQRDDWETPRYLYDKLNEEFGFTLDAAANDMNHKCEHYFTKEDSAFDHTWENETVFCNPPYGRQIRDWVRKCSQEASRIGTTVVMLLPARTDTIWFQQYILNNAEVRFIPGRLKYELGGGSWRFGTVPKHGRCHENRMQMKTRARCQKYSTTF